MQVACCQMDIDWENKTANYRRVRELLSNVDLLPETILALPEMFSSGFSMNVDEIAESQSRETERFLSDLARERNLFVLGGVVSRNPDGKGRNESVVFDTAGHEIARYQKMQPFSPGGESIHYAAGPTPVLFDWNGIRVAPFICYDLRFPEVFRVAARQGAELYVVIASWPVVRIAHWVTLLQARAIENQAYVVGVNRVGSDPSLIYSGRSLIVDPHGNIIADAGSEEGIITAELDIDAMMSYRSQLPFLGDIRPDLVKL